MRPAAVVQDGSLASQRTLFSTVGQVAADVAREQLRPPAIVVIGDVVGVASSLGAVPA